MVLIAISGVNFVFTKMWLIPMNQQKSLAEKIAENRIWIESECRKLGLEETTHAAGDTTKQVEGGLATNREFVSKFRPQQKSS
ncbi:MAG TPA: hypothetical protein V6D48_24285 [Oculatellaceae cyanobacterium]